MFPLLYYTLQLAIRMAPWGLFYSIPLFLLTAGAYLLYFTLFPNNWIAAMLVAVLMVFAAPYVAVMLQCMLQPYDAPPSFLRGVILQPEHLNFLVFISVAFFLVCLFMLFTFETALFLSDIVRSLETERDTQDAAEYSFRRSSILIFLFGSRIAALAAFVVSVFLWIYLFRSIIRLPAYIDGYDVNSQEVMEISEYYKFPIIFVSMFLNGFFGASWLWLVPWEDGPLWLRAVAAGAAMAFLLHLNSAFAVTLYRSITPGYNMRKLRKARD